MPKPTGKKKLLAAWIEEKKLAAVDGPAFERLRVLLEPISDQALRHLLREAGVPIEQPYGGVRQRSFDELAESLIELEQVYRESLAGARVDRAHYCRRVVIEAKDHARLASRNPRVSEEKRRQKTEMVEWMLVWLENPGVFPLWVGLRRKSITEARSS